MYGAETLTFWNVDQKCLEKFEMGCWRRLGKINWTGRVKNEVLQKIIEEKNIIRGLSKKYPTIFFSRGK